MLSMPHDLRFGNSLLAALEPEDFRRLGTYLTPVELRHGEVLVESGEEFRHVHFPHDCVVSLVVTMREGDTLEAGIVGREGMLGFAAALGDRRSLTRNVVQVPGRASRLELAQLEAALAVAPRLRRLCLCFVQALFGQIVQTVACNALHPAEARLCRWLLMFQDRQGDGALRLTQDYLAEMLGVQRTTVSLIAGKAQQAGLIRYRRGVIEILDRAGLERASCECYAAVRAQYGRLLPSVG